MMRYVLALSVKDRPGGKLRFVDTLTWDGIEKLDDARSSVGNIKKIYAKMHASQLHNPVHGMQLI